MAIIESELDPAVEVELEHEPTPAEIEEAEALALVTKDAAYAESWIQGQQWTERWDEIDVLYDSPRIYKNWEQTSVMQPNVQRYIISRHVNSIHPSMQEGIFLDNPPFEALERPGTDANTVRARAAVINYQLQDMEFETEVSNGLFQDILHGTGIWKWGMEWVEVEDLTYARKAAPIKQSGPLGESITVNTDESDEFDEVPKMKRMLKPFLENVEIRTVLVDPGLRLPDIRKAKYVIHRSYVTLADLLEMKKDENYNLPAEAEMRSWFETPKEEPQINSQLESSGGGTPSIAGQGEAGYMKTTEDPSLQGLPILERTDQYKIITTLNGKKVIQNRENPYKCINYFSCNWFNRIRAFWGLGVGKIVAQDQRLSQGVTNGGLALLQLLLDPPFAVDQDSNVATQNTRFRKGGFIKVKTKNGDVTKAIMPLEMPRLPVAEIFAFLQNSENESEAADGASALTMQGSIPGAGGKSSITRTKGGVDTFAGASASRLQGPLDRFLNQVFIPWLYKLDELNTRFLPMPQVRDIVGEELGRAFSLDELGFKNGRMKFTALAGTRMAAKRVMAQSLPIISQIFAQPEFGQQLAIQGKYVDWLEIAYKWLQATGWPSQNAVIKDMTDEMKQAQQDQNPAAQKAKAEAGQQQQKFQNAQTLQQDKIKGGMARDAVKTALDNGLERELRQADEKATDPLLDTGEVGGGFGE